MMTILHIVHTKVQFSTHSFNESKQSCKAKKQDIMESVSSCILARTESSVIQKVEVVLNMNFGFPSHIMILIHQVKMRSKRLLLIKRLNSLYEHFGRVIGHQCPVVTVLEEWHDLANYTLFLEPLQV